jgi:hypothetical protein
MEGLSLEDKTCDIYFGSARLADQSGYTVYYSEEQSLLLLQFSRD